MERMKIMLPNIVCVDDIELDCEPHQIIRKLYSFKEIGSENDDTYVNVIGKACMENDEPVIHAYFENNDEIPREFSRDFLESCLVETKIMIAVELATTLFHKQLRFAN